MDADDAIAARGTTPDRPARRRFHDVRRVPETGSTNSDVLALAREGEAEGIVVVADHQTAGRGRVGRTWSAPPGSSLLCTVLLRPPVRVAPLATFALAVAAAEAIEELTGLAPGLKWPNDLVVEDDSPPGAATRKLGGILAEAEWPAGSEAASGARTPHPDERAAVAAGIGLNVRWPDELPEELADVAVALNHLTGAEVDRDRVLEALLDHLDVTYQLLLDGRVTELLERWRARSSTLGRRVRVDLGAEDVEGDAVDITDAGQLVVETDGGERRVIAVGDVVHLRGR